MEMLAVALVPFLEATIRTATPLAFAALGELVAERAGVINIGLEGAIVAGCFGALISAGAGGVGAGFVGAAFAGMLMTALFAFFVVTLRTDQIITGTALTLLGLGLTGTLYRAAFGALGATLTVPTIAPVPLPILSQMPFIGPALFNQPLSTYALYFIIPAMVWWMRNTHAGLALRATGEHAEAARAAGIPTDRVRWLAILFSGLMGGLSGATLVLAQVGSFNEGMSAGRGFIAIAVVVLGRWTPLGTAGAALLFGAAFALQYAFQALDWAVPYQAFLALPYVLTLVLLASMRGRTSAPAELGR
ncbi:MAG TPA: ABC transporter permease [Gemmatimonadaceae bacterium]|nr:ABC transporter permease [Gemmatimonadaceae bacterium]